MSPRDFHPFAIALVAFFVASSARGQSTEIEFFETKIRPVLVEHCYRCHSAQAKKVKGGLLLDTRDAIRKGGDRGPAVVPGQPDKSLVLEALRHKGLKMPPDAKLPAAVAA